MSVILKMGDATVEAETRAEMAELIAGVLCAERLSDKELGELVRLRQENATLRKILNALIKQPAALSSPTDARRAEGANAVDSAAAQPKEPK
jgi:hypothetical protein